MATCAAWLSDSVSARLHKQSTFRKPTKFDRRETSPATMYGRILVKDGREQMVEALNQPSASEGLRDGLGRGLSSQFLRGHAVGIGHIDDGLTLPGGQRLRDISVRLERTAKKTMSALIASAIGLPRPTGSEYRME
jgi:hypothetical protein